MWDILKLFVWQKWRLRVYFSISNILRNTKSSRWRSGMCQLYTQQCTTDILPIQYRDRAKQTNVTLYWHQPNIAEQQQRKNWCVSQIHTSISVRKNLWNKKSINFKHTAYEMYEYLIKHQHIDLSINRCAEEEEEETKSRFRNVPASHFGFVSVMGLSHKLTIHHIYARECVDPYTLARAWKQTPSRDLQTVGQWYSGTIVLFCTILFSSY